MKQNTLFASPEKKSQPPEEKKYTRTSPSLLEGLNKELLQKEGVYFLRVMGRNHLKIPLEAEAKLKTGKLPANLVLKDALLQIFGPKIQL